MSLEESAGERRHGHASPAATRCCRAEDTYASEKRYAMRERAARHGRSERNGRGDDLIDGGSLQDSRCLFET